MDDNDNATTGDETTPAGDRIAQLEAKIAEYEAEEARRAAEQQYAEWVRQVSEQNDIPAEILRGDTLEELQAHAAALAPIIHPRPKVPAVHGVDRQPEGNPFIKNNNILRDLRYLNY
ncbi:hypothetical protein [Bifidobacterium aerophilum]|uniref:Uncharacterized protein n=1 Tax=Bifidobacterium aerophilum TaxID=1798155 RepID=A0A6N9Z1U7_9BIFI|nr:hypothetical protein [Bifidobacterium aerophilum]NEG88607.1 hypothetical protein [Bifidobacterium aerophilum]